MVTDFGLDSWEDIQTDQTEDKIGNLYQEFQLIETRIQMDL